MQQPSVLVVGAGAVGLVVGYHLGLGGTAVTFLVRSSRRDAMQSPQRLYCYDDAQIKEFTAYEVVTTATEVAERRFDYVLFTPDATACRSAEGTKLLRELGNAIRPTTAVLIMVAVGIGLREHVLAATGLPEARLLEGTLGNAAHQVSAGLPQHAPTDATKVAQASIAYRHFANCVGFMLAPTSRDAARGFAALYNRCGISRCALTNAAIYRLYTNAFFCFTMASDLMGWPDAAALTKDHAMLSLCVNAAKDIMGMAQFGWIGKVLRPMFSEKSLLKMIGKFERELRPLDFTAFNRFHHGGKVLAQDVEVLRNCLREGRAQGRPMASLAELLQRYDAQDIKPKRSSA